MTVEQVSDLLLVFKHHEIDEVVADQAFMLQQVLDFLGAILQVVAADAQTSHLNCQQTLGHRKSDKKVKLDSYSHRQACLRENHTGSRY